MNPVLVKANLTDYPVIQNMARFYVYDLARYCGRMPCQYDWTCPDNGLYESNDLKVYFDIPCHAFFIKMGEEKAGFALINKTGTTPDVDWNLGEFFILGKFQGTGVGQDIAGKIFDQFPGIWEVMCMPNNTGAYAFWAKAIARYSKGAFTKELKTIEKPTPHQNIVFRLDTRKAA